MVDLFSAILDADTPRDHPAPSALLYSYCPAAAGWWKFGARAAPPSYDVAWHVLTDYVTGVNLKSVLESYGVGSLLGKIKNYLGAVSGVRREHPALQAPELLPIYDLVKTETRDRFGLQDSLRDHFGGDWRNVFEYARIWAFIVPDWTIQILHHGGAESSIQQQELVFRMPHEPVPIRFPAFVWRSRIQRTDQPRIGFVSGGAVPDQVRCIVGLLSAPNDAHEWGTTPLIYILDPITGKVKPFKSAVPTGRMVEILRGLARAGKSGPYPPLAALNDPVRCRPCPFNNQCLNSQNVLSEIPLRFINSGNNEAGLL
jgi:hypothetical protein